MNKKTERGEMLITLTTDIVAAHVSNNSASIGDISSLIANVHYSLSGLSNPKDPIDEQMKPAVPIRSSVKPDYIICLEDGKKMKMIKRHLMTRYGMTPNDYRSKWGLPADYPMVAPNYAAQRKELAHKIGLGRKPKAAATPRPAAKRRGRKATSPVAAE